MNKTNNETCWRGFAGFWALAALAGGFLLASGGVASADYGQGAMYQIELSAQIPGAGGIWLWIALYPDDPNNPTSGEADFAGSDCAGGLNGHQHLGGEGAAADGGDTTWYLDGDNLVIDDVVLNGFNPPCSTTIVVPSMYGHYTAMGIGAYIMNLCLPSFITSQGFSQLQVAP
jgi:hypothetical protein